MNFLFLHVKKIFILPIVLNGILANYRVLLSQIIFLITSKTLFHCLLTNFSSDKKFSTDLIMELIHLLKKTIFWFFYLLIHFLCL